MIQSEISISLASSIRINSCVPCPWIRSSTYRSGENASCPMSALVRDGHANHAREPGRDIMQKEFSDESHSWWKSCVEEQCECFNIQGHAIQDSACGIIFIKTCVRAFEACKFRIASVPFCRFWRNWRKSHSRICHLSCIEGDISGKQVVLEIKRWDNDIVSHSSKLFSIILCC
ncbi:hypothetical protein CDAR_577761 [Caerostris darwini]|uniref:Uncharacterized protein n=1 Tax=Caerostris darwini TaxID=1538125 RepID=A0AAV4RF44_9ARAC|nr:hypothetical protein CDAR_577761 [Caerostris darwini]